MLGFQESRVLPWVSLLSLPGKQLQTVGAELGGVFVSCLDLASRQLVSLVKVGPPCLCRGTLQVRAFFQPPCDTAGLSILQRLVTAGGLYAHPMMRKSLDAAHSHCKIFAPRI